MMDLFLEALFPLQTIAILLFVFFYNRDVAQERQKLYDRIQAQDLREYKLLEKPVEPMKKEEKERVNFV